MDISQSGGLGVCSSEDGELWVWETDTGESRVHETWKNNFCIRPEVLSVCFVAMFS